MVLRYTDFYLFLDHCVQVRVHYMSYKLVQVLIQVLGELLY